MPDQLEYLNIDDIKPELFNLLESAPVGIISFYADGKISFINKNSFRFGITQKMNYSRLLGSNIYETGFFPGIDLQKELVELKEGIPFEKIINRVKTLDGGEISIIIKASPLYSDEIFSGGILIVEDIKIAKDSEISTEIGINVFKDVFNSLSEIVLILDPDGNISYIYGNKAKQLTEKRILSEGKNIASYIDNKTISQFNESLVNIKSGASQIQFSLSFKNSPEVIYSAVISPFIINTNKIKFIFVQLTDFTERVTERERLIAEISELKQFQAITESIVEAMMVIDKDGKIKFWNKPANELFGLTKSEVYNKNISKVINIFEKEQFSKIKDELIENQVWKNTVTVLKKDGKKEIVEAVFSPVNNTVDFILILFSNITERTEIEKALRSSEEKFRNIVTFSNELICNMEPDGTITYINPVFSKVFELSEEEIIGRKLFDFIDSGFLRKNRGGFDTFLQKINNSFEFPLITKSNARLFLHAHIFPVYNLNNSVKYYSGIFTNITEKKEDEKKLLIIKSFFTTSQDALSVVLERKIILVNDAFLSIYGYMGIDEVLGKDPLDFVADSEMTKVAGFIKARENRRESPNRFECLGRKKDNSSFYLESLTTSFEFGGQVYIIMEARDITERKRSQQAIKESEEKYRSITENIDDFMWTAERIDGKLKSVFYTSSVEKIMGYSQTDFIKDPKLFIKIILPDDMPNAKSKFRNIMRSTIRNSEELEFRIINKQGNVVWIRNKIKLIRGADKTVQKIFGLVSDISLRKKAEEELKKSTEDLVKLNETKDRFISIISHDLRTPFTSILGFTDLLLSDKGLDEEEKTQYVKFIQESAQSMFSLVNSLLDWTRLQTGRMKFEPEKTDAKAIVDKSFRSLSGVAMQKDISLINEIEEDVLIFADGNLLLQVFNNIISNSIKFTPNGGRITVSEVPFVLNRNYEFCIKDTGMGIKKENLSKLFNVDTKFTTEGTAGEKGSGLGLSLCKEIIEKHNGKIWVESEFGKGSSFKFTLPFASSNILYVEDSKTDRLLYSKIIKNIAEEYEVIVANSGEEGFEKVKAYSPALLITDHIMPGMSGYELVSKIMHSDLSSKPPVIVLSADVDRSITDDYYQLGIEYVFRKPVNLISFKMAVEKSLKKGLKLK